MKKYRFLIKTGEILIDYRKCKNCESFACVKACSLFGRNLLKIENQKPILRIKPEQSPRLCIECLACEIYCQEYGQGGLKIFLKKLR